MKILATAVFSKNSGLWPGSLYLYKADSDGISRVHAVFFRALPQIPLRKRTEGIFCFGERSISNTADTAFSKGTNPLASTHAYDVVLIKYQFR